MKALNFALASALAACALAACGQSPSPTEPAPPPPVTQAPPPPSAPAPSPTTSTSIPTRFLGAWASDEAACTTAGNESRLVLAADRVQFHESSGPVKETTLNGDELTVVAALTGEGETREATYRFTLSDRDRTLTDRDSGMVRRRCDG